MKDVKVQKNMWKVIALMFIVEELIHIGCLYFNQHQYKTIKEQWHWEKNTNLGEQSTNSISSEISLYLQSGHGQGVLQMTR